MNRLYKAIGLMTGTSMDGIDAALIETDGLNQIRFLEGFSIAHESDFYTRMKALETAMKADYLSVPEAEKNKIIRQIDDLHVQVVLELSRKYNHIDIIGYHGQTVYHQPSRGISIQLGDAKYVANQLGIPVMGNVRQKDIQMGGQGAPVAPIYHQALVIRDNLAPAAVINCGGISNVSLVLGKETSELYGFDAGPGNGMLDRWVVEKTQGKERMDKDGKFGLAGRANQQVLKELYEHSCIRNGINYYQQKPPKSLDIRDFYWTESLAQLSLEDGCATLAVFTAQCIVDAITKQSPKNIILVGGGWHHPLISQTLKEKMPEQCVLHADEIGWSSQYMEAELMAYLAVRRLNNLPITFPTTTGTPLPTIGGDIFRPHLDSLSIATEALRNSVLSSF